MKYENHHQGSADCLWAGLALALILSGCGVDNGTQAGPQPAAAPTNRTSDTVMALPPLPMPMSAAKTESVSDSSSLASGRAVSAVAGPTNLTASLQNITTVPVAPSPTNQGSITIAWNPSQDPTCRGYRVFVGPSAVGVTISADVGLVTNVTLNGLAEGLRYTCYVVAYDSQKIESMPSNFVDFICPVRTYIRPYAYAVETYGVAGATNSMQISSDLLNWVTVTNFIGKPAILFGFAHVATNGPRYFRTIQAP